MRRHRQQCLNLRPLPHGQGEFRGDLTTRLARMGTTCATSIKVYLRPCQTRENLERALGTLPASNRIDVRASPRADVSMGMQQREAVLDDVRSHGDSGCHRWSRQAPCRVYDSPRSGIVPTRCDLRTMATGAAQEARLALQCRRGGARTTEGDQAAQIVAEVDCVELLSAERFRRDDDVAKHEGNRAGADCRWNTRAGLMG
jgi:hypothetical protein